MNQTSQMGDFTLFGFTLDPDYLLHRRIPERLGVSPRSMDFGSAGTLFFHTTYGEVAETGEAVCIKLGFLRSLEQSALSAENLLVQGIVKPGFLDHDRMRGNALVVCLDKKKPSISAFKTLLSIPQLYYAQVNDGIICSDRLKCIVQVLDKFDLNDDIIPMHFLFRFTPGEFTYFRQIHRLLPGGFFNWVNGEFTVKLVQDLRFINLPEPSFREGVHSLEPLYETLLYVVGDYVGQAERSGRRLATLLSGGVDSSLLQYLVNQKTAYMPARSYSFAVHAPSFDFEIEYARKATHLFHMEHTYVDIQPVDYPELLIRTTDILAQPPALETEPSMLAIAEFVETSDKLERYFISGQGADAMFGLPYSRKLKVLHIASKIPGASVLLKGLGIGLKPSKRISQMLIKGGAILACEDDPDAFLSPANSIAVYSDLDISRRCFGDVALIHALKYRRDLAARYFDMSHFLEKVHIIDLLTDAYEIAIQRQQIFLAHEREKIHPFFDDDILRASFAIPPYARYIQGMRPKYLLKELLTQKTGAESARRHKGSSIWEADLIEWMQYGPLRPLVNEIDRPGFLDKNEFDRLLTNPNYFLWVLLTFDIFRRCFKV